jgi:hypothetical protein
VQEDAGEDATVTVNLTDCWNTDGFAFETTLVVVLPLFTSKVKFCEPEFWGVAESVTVALTLYGPATHGVPEIVGEKLGCEPKGKPLTVQLKLGVPPSSVSVVGP